MLPTTTIGSFPQTKEVRAKRLAFRKNELSQEEYDAFLAEITDEWIKWQEEVGFDVIVHGEFERNDMVEYFGQNFTLTFIGNRRISASVKSRLFVR